MPCESFVDVLVIGAGPAGAAAALALSRQGIKARVIDKRAARILEGHGDGLNPRTLDVMESLGVLDEMMLQSRSIDATSDWQRDPSGQLLRTRFVKAAHGNFARHVQRSTTQSAVENVLLSAAEDDHGLQVTQGALPTAISINDKLASDPHAHAVNVTVQHLLPGEADPFRSRAHDADAEGNLPDESTFFNSLVYPPTADLISKCEGRQETQETIHAKYVVAADGAHSWVRSALNIALQGDRTEYVWGALDIVPITNFPDIRTIGIITTPQGSVLLIPRERNMIRMYTKLDAVPRDASGRPDLSQITPHSILRRIQACLSPYTITYRHCKWWTGYQISQRIAERYSDPARRVFCAGDAMHTHSPKEGLGMNTSIQDAFNLSWKLAGVLKHTHNPNILATYEAERRSVAQTLIKLDKKINEAYATGGTAVRGIYSAMMGFLTGSTIVYPPSMLVAETDAPPNLSHLAPGTTSIAAAEIIAELTSHNNNPPDSYKKHQTVVAKTSATSAIAVGAMLMDRIVVNQASLTPEALYSAIRMDGRWSILVFAGDLSEATALSRLNDFGAKLETAVLAKYPGCVRVVTIHSAQYDAVELSSLHRTFFPYDETKGHDYAKVFTGEGGVYEKYGVARDETAVVLVRPDTYVGWVGDFGAVSDMQQFLGGVLLERSEQVNNHA